MKPDNPAIDKHPLRTWIELDRDALAHNIRLFRDLLERTLTKELGEGDLGVTPENLKKVFAHTADSFLGLVRQVLDMQYLPDYKDVVARQFETYVTQHNYNADQIRFLRAVQSVFLQKRHLETADMYEPPLDMFGADAVERWFTEKEINVITEFAN